MCIRDSLVTGCARYISKRDTSNHDFVGIKGHKDLQIIELDIVDQYSVFKVIYEGQYDEVYNLAANSFVPSSKDSPEDVFRAVSYTHLDVYKRQREIRMIKIILVTTTLGLSFLVFMQVYFIYLNLK